VHIPLLTTSQSAAQVISSSFESQVPSPHTPQIPKQSAEHVEHSPPTTSQMVSPQVAGGGHEPQSAAHDVHVSFASQVLSPHIGPGGSSLHMPEQSPGHRSHSPAAMSHVPSPHGSSPIGAPLSTQEPQSDAHDEHDSSDEQVPSPQLGCELSAMAHAVSAAAAVSVINQRAIVSMCVPPSGNVLARTSALNEQRSAARRR
jgi:hypothetical protein